MEISGSITESNDLDENVEATSLPAKSIKAIDKTAVHKICSGQVVLTLATAVKELVENSIDAGSSSIEIRLKDHGSTLIEVLDNGKGVEACDFEGLTLKHHTSKLQDFGDLVGVKTFGFRGEALSSLCALSTLTVTTRHHSQSVGTRLVYDMKGNLLQQTPVSRQVGTTVTLQDLFHTLPVRHKEFLRNIKKEFTKMVHVLYSYCLIATNVRISCTNQVGKNSKTTVVSTESHCSLKENISSIFGHKQVTNLLEIVQRKPSEELLTDYGMTSIADTESFTIEGFVSSCDHGKGRCSADRQFYFINNRPCDPAKITRLVNEVYHHYNKHQYPMVVMNIRMKEDDVDINVTPDKRQIMVNKEKFLLATVKATLVGLYENIPSNYTVQQTPLFRQITNPSPVQSPSSKRVSSLLERFSRSPASPSSLPQNGSGKSPVSTSFANLKRSLTSQSQFESSPKQQKLQDFSFESNVLTNSPNNKKENQCTTEVCLQGDIKEASPSAPSQHVHCDDNTSEEKENIGHQLVSNCSVSNGNVIDKNIRNLSVFSASKSPDVKSSSPLNSHRSKIHSKTDDFLKNLKARSFSVNKSSKLSSDSKNSPNESKATGTSIKSSETDEQNDILYLGSNQVTDSELVQSPSVFTYDDLPESDHKFACHKSKVKKSVTIPFEIGNIRKSLLSKAKNSEKEEAMFRKFRATISPTDNQAAEEELKKEIHKESFRNMNIIGQFNLGFIIARLQSDLFIIDQHATDEKYNFETLQKTCVLQNQKLIIPQTLELTPANEMILIDNLDIFKRNGFVFKIDESKPVGSRVLLTSIPHSKGWEFNKDDIDEMIFLLSDSPGVMCRPSRVNAMFASRACRKSIMIGTALGHAQMRKLLNHMSEIEQPWNCPHGRPTLRHIINLDMLSKNK